MKTERQAIIKEIISEKKIETQQQLMDELLLRGIDTTQATLSRDMRDLRLVKESAGKKLPSYYVISREPEGKAENDDLMRKLLKPSLKSYDNAGNLIVIKTYPGLASAACAAIDGMDIPNLVGTIAGDDTIFVAMKTELAAEDLVERLHELI